MTAHEGGSTPGRKRSWLVRALVALGVVGAIAMFIGYGVLKDYLHSEGFRKFLSTKVSRAAGVEGEFSAFRWSGLSAETDSFDARGDGRIVRLRAEGLEAGIGLGSVFRGAWTVKDAGIRKLEVDVLASREEEDADVPAVDAPVTRKERPRPWYPSRVELRDFEIGRADIRATMRDGDPFVLENTSFKASSGKKEDSFIGEIRGGVLRLPDDFWPQIHLGQIAAEYQDEILRITRADATMWSGARLDATGEWNRPAETYDFKGRVEGIGIEELVREKWSQRIVGKVSSDFTASGGPDGNTARGTLRITDGVLTALPVLEVLAAYVDTQGFRELKLTEAQVDWTWTKEEISLENLNLGSEGKLSIRGGVKIRGEDLDGELSLGLSPKILSVVQGAEAMVFTPGEGGLLWTKVRISGTVDDPKEDLSDRLMAVAGFRILEEIPGGDKVLKHTRKYLGDDPEDAFRKGKKTFDETEKAVRETRDLLKGIFGK